MAIDESARFELHEAARHGLGEANANTLMSMLPPVGWADVATKADLVLLTNRMDSLADRLRAELHTEMNRQLRWIVGLNLTLDTLIIAAAKLL